MNFNPRFFLLFVLLIPNAFLAAQNSFLEPQTYYEVISDSAEIAEIKRKCLLEMGEGFVHVSGTVKSVLSLAELKALLQEEDPWRNYLALVRLKDGKVKDVQAADAELIQLVSKFIVENDYRQAAAFEALLLVDPENAARKIIKVLQQDEMRRDQRHNAKRLLGETEPSQATIDYLIDLLSLEKRTVFEQEDNAWEVSALLELYDKSDSKQRIEIFDFVFAYNEKHPSLENLDWALRKKWAENPEPKYLKMMEALLTEDLANPNAYTDELLSGILKLKGKQGNKLVEKLMENSDGQIYYPILAWAHTQGEIELQERILKGYATGEYASPDRHLDAISEIGGQQLADQYLSYFEGFEDLQTYRDFVRVQYAPIDHLNPYRQFADTLFKIGFLESPLSNEELAAMRAVEYHTSENRICYCSIVKNLPCFYEEDYSQSDFSNYLNAVMVPVANGALDGLEFFEYTTGGFERVEWLIFKGKAYRHLGDGYTEFYTLDFLLELHGIKERFFEIPQSDSDLYRGGFYTTPEMAHVLFSLIGRDPWKK